MEIGVPNQLPCKIQKWLFIIVIAFGRDLMVLKVLLPVECYLFWLHLPVLDINFITTQNNRNVFTHPAEISIPSRNVLVSQPGRDIEHYDSALSVNVVPVSKTTEFFLSRGIPAIESDNPPVGVEVQRMYFDSDSGFVFLLELSS